tara:strand:- start:681 stop:854 length:174 start_codon:yes stop_codon:yes gene_type:complete
MAMQQFIFTFSMLAHIAKFCNTLQFGIKYVKDLLQKKLDSTHQKAQHFGCNRMQQIR